MKRITPAALEKIRSKTDRVARTLSNIIDDIDQMTRGDYRAADTDKVNMLRTVKAQLVSAEGAARCALEKLP